MRQCHLRRAKRAYALIVVLIAVVLCALMVIILMERSTVGLKSAAVYSDASRVRTLADMVQYIVQAQIHDATTQNQTAGVDRDQRDTWASQPGALRVFTPTGALRNIYKLYSSSSLTTSDPDLSLDVPSDWFDHPALYTDLNAPVRSGSDLHYPIMNPNAAALNPGASGIANGFSITNAPIEADPSANLAPMPVRWIYLLQDGTLCQLGDSAINRVSNPIVGRIAFWTDDETCKVNINTAAPVTAQSYWDIPRTGSSSELNLLAWRQPAQNEYQRYPGHPAMVSLRSILGPMGGLNDETWYQLTPRYYWGGSEDGGKRVNDPRIPLITLKQDRAYTSVDELLFASSPQGTPATTRRSEPTVSQIDGLRFFLSASSRAPELNLFGQPRLTIWPVHEETEPTYRTPYDQLIAFCSTIGGKEYFFKRAQPLSPIYDYDNIPRNIALYAYLQEMTEAPIPGFDGTGTFLSKYGDHRDQILTQIFDYIRIVNLNETWQGRDPAFQSYTPEWKVMNEAMGNAETVTSVTSHYPPDGEAQGAGLVVPIEIGSTRGIGRFPVIAEVGLMFITHSEKKPTATSGVPVAPHPENREQLEAMLVIETITPAFGYMPWMGKDLTFELVSSDLKFSIGAREIALFPATTYGAHNTRPIHYPPLLRGGQSPGGYDGAAYITGPDGEKMSGNTGGGAAGGLYRFTSPPLDLEIEPSPTGSTAPYRVKDTHFSVAGGTLRLDIKVGTVVVQSYSFEFPSIPSLPIPTRSEKDYSHNYVNATGEPFGKPWWRARFHTGMQGPFKNSLVNSSYHDDVLHGMELWHGDARLVATKKQVPANFFKEHRDYGQYQPFAHGMRSTYSGMFATLWNGASLGTYVDLPLAPFVTQLPDVLPEYFDVQHSVKPKIPSSISSLRDHWSGDFDNGMSRFIDGPFINKADEGMMHSPLNLALTEAPYSSWKWSLANGLFSPLRQVPSAVMFGSLPAGEPWRTLLFCANPADPDHGGFDSPPDHLLLDLFRMPVVEPYAISGPASTDGKINMNYAIAPFSYLRRASSWYALLEPLKMLVIPDSESTRYKGVWNSAAHSTNYRRSLNISETLRQFDERFAAHKIFHAPSEICSLFLVPSDATLESVSDHETGYWAQHRLTGDNSREKPYAELYAKLTTQSNTYQIHFRVQVLPPSDAIPAGKSDFEPLAEYRGSRLLERYLDPNHPRFNAAHPDRVDPDKAPLNELYQYRVLEARQFNP